MKNDCNSIEELNALYNESEQAYNEASKDFMNIMGLFSFDILTLLKYVGFLDFLIVKIMNFLLDKHIKLIIFIFSVFFFYCYCAKCLRIMR